MAKNKINKISKYILIGFGLLVVGFINDLFINEPKLREKGKYTIGYIYIVHIKEELLFTINSKLGINFIIVIQLLEKIKKNYLIKNSYYDMWKEKKTYQGYYQNILFQTA